MGTNQDNIVSIDKITQALPAKTLEEHVISQQAISRVVSDPLPGPMLDAVANQELEVMTSQGKVILRPVVIYDFTIFKKLNSPHYRTMIEHANKQISAEEINVEDEELYEMIYQFTHTCKEIRQELKKGREQFREIATEEVADKYSMIDLGVLLNGIAQQINKGFATMTPYGTSEKDESGDDVVKKKP